MQLFLMRVSVPKTTIKPREITVMAKDERDARKFAARAMRRRCATPLAYRIDMVGSMNVDNVQWAPDSDALVTARHSAA